jgi:hypothetical protein
MLQSRTQPTSLHKAKAHTNITGNEIVDILAKNGRHKQHSLELSEKLSKIEYTYPQFCINFATVIR